MIHGGLFKGLRRRFESGWNGSLPDFLVIGCMRCGTTGMTRALARHSQLVPIRGGRNNFFVNDEQYFQGIDWYKRGFPGIKERQCTEKALGRPCLAYETTPSYIFFQNAVERIAAVLPGVRCIALLRNPVDRIWSHHIMRISSKGSHDDLMPILQEDLRRYLIRGLPRFSGARNFPTLLGRSLYGKQVKRWYEHMGRDNLLLLRSEDFYLNPQQALDEVQEFLGIKREILPVEKINSSPYVEGGGGGGGSPASRRLDPGGPGGGRAVAGISDRTAMELVVRRSGANAGRGAPPPQVADWIREVLAEDMQLLESVTGRQWNWW